MIKILSIIGSVDAITMIIMGFLVVFGIFDSVSYIPITLSILAIVGGLKAYYMHPLREKMMELI